MFVYMHVCMYICTCMCVYAGMHDILFSIYTSAVHTSLRVILCYWMNTWLLNQQVIVTTNMSLMIIISNKDIVSLLIISE